MEIYAVAGAMLDGRDVVVAAGSGGIAVWDAAEGECLTPWSVALDTGKTSRRLAMIDSLPDSIVVTGGGSTGSVHVWDLQTGLPQQLVELGHHIESLSAAAAGDHALAIVTTGRWTHGIYDWGLDTGASVWDVQARQELRRLQHSETTTAVALTHFDGRACAAVAGYRTDPEAPYSFYPEDAQFDDTFGSLAVFDALNGEPLSPLTELGRNWHANSLALAEISGRLHAFAARCSGGLQVVDVAAGQVQDGPSWSGRVGEVVTGGLPRRPLILARSAYSKDWPPVVWLWDPQTGETLFQTPPRWSGYLGLTRAGRAHLPGHGCALVEGESWSAKFNSLP